MPKAKPQGWSVSGQKLLDKIKPNTPPEIVAQIEEQARLQGVKDVFGYDVEFDSQGRPIESGIGSTKWLVNASEEVAERHYAALGRFVGPAAAQAERERIARLKGKK